MPGKKGQKMIARLSTSKKFHSVKELVFSLFEKNPAITKEEAEKVVKKEYPNANFMGKDGRSGHFTWYKHRWNRMKLENANFNIKENHPKKDEEKNGHTSSDESKKDRVAKVKVVDKKSMGKSRNRRKGGRISLQSEKRKVVVKTGKDILQRKGSTKSSERDIKDKEVSN